MLAQDDGMSNRLHKLRLPARRAFVPTITVLVTKGTLFGKRVLRWRAILLVAFLLAFFCSASPTNSTNARPLGASPGTHPSSPQSTNTPTNTGLRTSTTGAATRGVPATLTRPPVRMVVSSPAGAPMAIHADNHGLNSLSANPHSSGKSVTVADSALNPNTPNEPITFVLDDGSIETSIGFGLGNTESAALWLNRFTPPTGAYPVSLNGIQIAWPTNSGAPESLIGKLARLVVYHDADGDGNPGNATFVASTTVTIGAVGTFENYPVNITVPGPTGDIYIGFEDIWAEQGYSPRLYPAPIDTTPPSRVRSWVAGMSNGAPPDITNIGNNTYLGTIDAAGYPGNWMIRATGGMSCPAPPQTTVQGDDSFTLNLNTICGVPTGLNLNIGRYYGNVDANGRPLASSLGLTIAPHGSLSVQMAGGTGQDTVNIGFAGTTWHIEVQPGVQRAVVLPVDASQLLLPSTTPTLGNTPVPAANPMTISHSSVPGSQRAVVKSVTLNLPGMRPLVLVGGINIDLGHAHDYASSLGYFDPGLWDNVYPYNRFVVHPLQDRNTSIADGGANLASQIEAFKREFGVRKVNILGHSMGGLWERQYALRNDPTNSVDNLIMLGTPNNGSVLADLAAGHFGQCFTVWATPDCPDFVHRYLALSPAIEQLTGPFMRGYNLFHGPAPGVTYTDLAGVDTNIPFVETDDAVTKSSAQALDYSHHLPVVYSHSLPIVHNQEGSTLIFQNPLKPIYGLYHNRYNSMSGGGSSAPNRTSPHDTATPTPAPDILWPSSGNVIQAGQTQTTTMQVDRSSLVSFNLDWTDNPTYTLGLTLVDSHGQVITPTSTYSGSAYIPTLFGVMYSVSNPLTGTWQAVVNAQSGPSGGEGYFLGGQFTGGTQLNPESSSDAVGVGQPVVLTSTLRDSAPIVGAVVTASIMLMSGGSYTATVPLAEQTGGIYRGVFTPTLAGTYSVVFSATGVNSQSEPFNRLTAIQVQATSGAALTGSYTEQAYDANNDGTYDSLVISATAAITQSGQYYLSGHLTTTDGREVAQASGLYTPTLGTVQLPLTFPGSDIGAAATDGPYQLRDLHFSQIISEELTVASLPLAYTTTNYTRYNWSRGNVIQAGTAIDRGVDTNNNGLYDYLEVSVPLDVRTAGVYGASLNLIAFDGSLVAASITQGLSLAQGANTLVMQFSGSDIRASGVNGPYRVEDLTLWNPAGSSTYIASVLPQTQTYNSLSFEGTVLVGHVTWQGRPSQPNALQQLPITLTLRTGSTDFNYQPQTTDANGFFTVSVGSLVTGTYNWRVKGPKFLANASTLALPGVPTSNVEMSLMRVGDANNDDLVSASDFIILKHTFGQGAGDPLYDDRADFNGDSLVSSGDFVLLKGNYGQGGVPLISPTATSTATGTPTETPTNSPTNTAGSNTATPTCVAQPTWSPGPNHPGNPGIVRAVGVYFPTNGKFYTMGGRTSDVAGNDTTNPYEYTPGNLGTWVTKAAVFPDNQVNNMACAALTVSGTPQIYCVGGSAAGATVATARVFSYNPATDTITTLAAGDNWPGDASGTILPGGFAVVANKMYIVGGFNLNTAMTNQTWQFDPTAAVGAKWTAKANMPVARGYVPAAAIDGLVYTGGGTDFVGTNLVDTADSYKYDPVANTWTAITNIPRVTGETRAVVAGGQMWVLGGGRTAPNPSNEVDIYSPGTNSWTVGTAFVTARRNFSADSDGSTLWLAGGYAPTTVTNTMEMYHSGAACGPTSTPTATATYDPGTYMPTQTSTQTSTNTPTNTWTNTPTDTPTNTPTLTSTNTWTYTPVSAATSTSTPMVTLTSTPTSTPTGTPNCDLIWTVDASPNLNTSADYLQGVALTSANDVWAVGYLAGSSGWNETLVEHWNGAAWSVVSSPHPGIGNNYLYGVAAVSANDVWAVGYYGDRGGGNRGWTLVEHWDGSAWSVVSSPSPGTFGSYLYGVAAVSANDVWAVGYYDGSTLTEHWNGAAWSVASSPSPGTNGNDLRGVATIATNDVWAVGYYYSSTWQTLVEHWNGTIWSVVSSPSPDTYGDYLNGVAAVAANDVWAVGYNAASTGGHHTLTEHWNGSAWSVVSSPNPSTHDNYLNGVAAVSANDVWAVGYYGGSSGGPFQTLVEHWNGSAWSVVLSPSPSTTTNYLNGVAAVSASDVWAMGFSAASIGGNQTLMEHWNGSAWSVVSSPNPGTSQNYLQGVAGASPNNVWAVGYYGCSSGAACQTLMENWNGSAWSVVSSPNVGNANNFLQGVAAVGTNDVWAVGFYAGSTAYRTLVEHWNGAAWSVVSSPNSGNGDNYLYGVAAVSTNDVWAVGDSGSIHWNGTQWSVVSTPMGGLKAVAAVGTNDVWAVGDSGSIHWNGTQWSVVSTPMGGLKAVAAVGTNDVWAVGFYAGSSGWNETLVEHWNGAAWSVVSSPNPGNGNNYLYGIAAVGTNDVWAVGYYWNSFGPTETLVEHWNGSTWSVISSPNPDTYENYLQAVTAVSATDVWAVGLYASISYYQTLAEHYTSPCATPTSTSTPAH
jgi:hypothetical protein